MTADRAPRSFWTRELSLPALDRRDVAALAGLGLVVVALFRELMFAGRVLYDRDMHLYWLPQSTAFVRSIARGSWPVWDPHVGFGQPMLATPNSQVLYPPTWLLLLLPPWQQHTLAAAGHLWFAAAGLFCLGRRLGLSRAAAWAAGAILAGSGPLLSLVNMPHHFAGASWMPWVLLAGEAALASRRARHAVLLGAALAAQLLAGSPDMAFFTGWILGARVVCALRWRPLLGAENARLLVVSGGAVLLAIGLSAAQWLPTLDVGSRSARWLLSEATRDFWSVHPLALLQLALPVMYKDIPLAVAGAPLAEEYQAPLLHSVYLGLPALALALGARGDAEKGRARFLLAVLAVGVLGALGRHFALHGVLVALLPFASSLRHPAKLMIAAAPAFALLCGLGLDSLMRLPRVAARRAALPAVALASAAGLVVLLVWLSPERFTGWLGVPADAAAATLASAARGVARACALTLALALVVGAPLEPALRAGLASALVLVDLVAFNGAVNPTADRSLYALRPPVLSALARTGESPLRVYVFDYLRLRTRGAAHRHPDMAPLVPPGWRPSLARAASLQLYLYPPIASRWNVHGSFDRDLLGLQPPALPALTTRVRAVEGSPLFARLLRLGAVDYVVALHDPGPPLQKVAELEGLFAGPILVFRLPDSLPRAYVVGGVRRAEGAEALRALEDPGFDPRTTVILEGHPSAPADGFEGACRIADLSGDRVVLHVEANRPGFLVLADAYDPGWRARVDGHETPVAVANAAFRAVPVPSGRHTVEMRYRPRAVQAGLLISAVAAAAGLVAAARAR